MASAKKKKPKVKKRCCDAKHACSRCPLLPENRKRR